MSTDDARRHDGGPLERSHIKDMVLRNALENAALVKTSRRLENQRRAFVRQSTRDEEEMRTLLTRLSIEQSGHHGNAGEAGEHGGFHETYTCFGENGRDSQYFDEVDGGFRAGGETEVEHEVEVVANPYPVTIIPRFGGPPTRKQSGISGRPVSHSSSWSRRKSIEYEDVQDSLLTVRTSGNPASNISEQQISASTSSISRDQHAIGNWLASPDAISSVRRMRRSVNEQSHRKLMRKASCESRVSDDSPINSGSSSPILHSRNNSLKERKRNTSGDDSALSPRIRKWSRRGGSLKERKTSKGEDNESLKPLAKSYSILSKDTTSLGDITEKEDTPAFRPKSESVSGKPTRKNSKKGQKQPLRRKSSTDSVASGPVSVP
ncbi:hypothetical protein MAR_020106 [Mya arenaria]|uniref:Uncharacterized protein n=1 Tax=Mya arenaria TaxID=6604 RepID=A0ABY7E7H3_MYAAR|nr:uncharacterized protein LOC128233370 [Mya arenaria]WAR04737.1 hypothetical protein MAR_020106 [Mya arenaria]